MASPQTHPPAPPAHANGSARPATTVTVQRATFHDLRRLGHVIADAFADVDQNIWLVPDPEMRPYVLPAYYALQVELGLYSGTVYTTPQRNAVAIWLPVAGRRPSLPDYDERMARIAGPLTNRFRALEAATATQQRLPDLHHWLAFLAVAPDHQRAGIGSQLMEYHHQVLDAGRIGGYVNAASPANRAFYQTLGWDDHAAPYNIVFNGPVMYPLVRHRDLHERNAGRGTHPRGPARSTAPRPPDRPEPAATGRATR